MNDTFLNKINEHLTLALDACIGEARQLDADFWAQNEQRYEAVVIIVDGIIGIRKDLSALKNRHR
jgi:hypothetical protein